MTGHFRAGIWIPEPIPWIPGPLEQMSIRIDTLEKRLAAATTTHVDVHYKMPSQVIVVGDYKGRDYVRAFTIDAPYLERLIEDLKILEKGSRLGRVDTPLHFDINIPRGGFL